MSNSPRIGARATLVHGYTMADIDHAAYAATTKSRSTVLSPMDAREEAWSAIVELLYLSPERPAWWSLTDVGAQAIDTRVRAELRQVGRGQAKEGGGYVDTPRFQMYWDAATDTHQVLQPSGTMHRVGVKSVDWTDAIIERLALPTALGVLTPDQYEAVSALAAAYTHADEKISNTALARAASMLGISRSAMETRIRAARARFLAAWFAPEEPPPVTKKKKGLNCRYGHSLAAHGHQDAAGNIRCKLCRRDAKRRRRAKGARWGEENVDLTEPTTPTPLTFAPAPDVDESVSSANTCWCGDRFGHEWPGKGEGQPHPRRAA